MKHISVSVLLVAVGTALAGCDKPGPDPVDVAASRQQEGDAFGEFLAAAWQARLADSPELAALTGSRADQDKWDDVSVESLDQRHFRVRTDLANMLKLDYTKLDADQRLSYELFENEAERRIEQHRSRLLPYLVNPYNGIEARVPELLIELHAINNEADAQAYIARLRAIAPLFAQVEARLAASEAAGVVPPKFIFPRVEAEVRALLRGRPFEGSSVDSPLLQDFKDKLVAVEMSAGQRAALVQSASTALTESVKPAYDSLLRVLKSLEKKATDEAGVWKLPGGDGYYRSMLRFHTTSDLSPGEMHEIGLAEVARIHGELQSLAPALGVSGPLPALFKAMHRPDAFYPDSAAGRDAYLKEATDRIEAARQRFANLFNTMPADPLLVKRRTPYRESFAGQVEYVPAADDGSRASTCFVNLATMTDSLKPELEALAYSGGIPGAHLQSAMTRAIEGLPEFRKHFPAAGFTAGWGLYALRLAQEAGVTVTPEAEYGRRIVELKAAVALVVDTGIHAKRWTHGQAVKYAAENLPVSRADATSLVERSSVVPAEGAAPMMGLLKLLELRQRAESDLGPRFDLREFHAAVLTRGPLPFNALAREVNDYIGRKRPQSPPPQAR